jgi:hypothetical protein
MRQHRFPVVHLNDSPLLAAAWIAHRNGAKLVWHLRSALAGEGRDRRSRAIAAWMERFGDAAIAIGRDVAEGFPIWLPLTIVYNSVGGRAASRARTAPARARWDSPRTVWRSASLASCAARRAGPSSSRLPISSSARSSRPTS